MSKATKNKLVIIAYTSHGPRTRILEFFNMETLLRAQDYLFLQARKINAASLIEESPAEKELANEIESSLETLDDLPTFFNEFEPEHLSDEEITLALSGKYGKQGE